MKVAIVIQASLLHSWPTCDQMQISFQRFIHFRAGDVRAAILFFCTCRRPKCYSFLWAVTQSIPGVLNRIFSPYPIRPWMLLLLVLAGVSCAGCHVLQTRKTTSRSVSALLLIIIIIAYSLGHLKYIGPMLSCTSYKLHPFLGIVVAHTVTLLLVAGTSCITLR